MTFGLGSGIAGLGGVALSQIGNVGPGARAELHRRLVHGRGARRRREARRHRRRGARARHRATSCSSRSSGAVLGKIFVLVLHHPLHPAAAAGHVRAQGPRGGGLSMLARERRVRSLHTPAQWAAFAAFLCVAGVLVPTLNLAARRGSALRVPDYLVPLFGKFLCFAIVALAIDLIWGYTGILSLGPRRVLRARRLRDGHVPDALDRRARASTAASCPTSWCSSTGRSCPGSGTASTTSASPR